MDGFIPFPRTCIETALDSIADVDGPSAARSSWEWGPKADLQSIFTRIFMQTFIDLESPIRDRLLISLAHLTCRIE